ncbi:MAG TPA: ABC-2 family transporter protein [Patescibacteria group bacterium]
MKYLRIYWAIIKINTTLLFTYRANFYNAVIITTGWGIISIVSIFLLTAKTKSVYGWSRDELYLLTGLYSIVIGLFHMFFSSSLERFARTISLGNLDSYLLSPIDVQLFLSTKFFRPVSSLRLIIAIAFTMYIMHSMNIELSILNLTTFCLYILLGVILLYSIWFLTITLTIWNPNLSNLVEFLYNFSNLARYPPALLLYTKNLIVFLFIPLTLITSVPARLITGKVEPIETIGLVVFSFGLFILSRLFWKYALRHYTSASS